MIEIELSSDQLKGALYHAELNCGHGIGAMRSRYHDDQTRKLRMRTDQAVGQVATCAVAKYLHGHTSTYFQTRFHRNQHPNSSDNGFDIGCANIDVKGSYMRYGTDPSRYSLLIHPAEVHDEWVYIQVLLGHPSSDPSDWIEVPPTIILCGWATTAMLPTTPIAEGNLAGALRIPIPELHPLPPIQHKWFEHEWKTGDHRPIM
tara:strand:- start:106 stop:714 length:609 start_codon:yes stop_codon:yes gene_type:complete